MQVSPPVFPDTIGWVKMQESIKLLLRLPLPEAPLTKNTGKLSAPFAPMWMNLTRWIVQWSAVQKLKAEAPPVEDHHVWLLAFKSMVKSKNLLLLTVLERK